MSTDMHTVSTPTSHNTTTTQRLKQACAGDKALQGWADALDWPDLCAVCLAQANKR